MINFILNLKYILRRFRVNMILNISVNASCNWTYVMDTFVKYNFLEKIINFCVIKVNIK